MFHAQNLKVHPRISNNDADNARVVRYVQKAIGFDRCEDLRDYLSDCPSDEIFLSSMFDDPIADLFTGVLRMGHDYQSL